MSDQPHLSCFKMQDLVTDLSGFESEDLDIDGVEEARAHAGMLTAAQCIARKLIGGTNRFQGRDESEPERPILDMTLGKVSGTPIVSRPTRLL